MNEDCRNHRTVDSRDAGKGIVVAPLKFITMRMKVNIEDNTMLMELFIDDLKTI